MSLPELVLVELGRAGARPGAGVRGSHGLARRETITPLPREVVVVVVCGFFFSCVRCKLETVTRAARNTQMLLSVH